MLGTAQAHASAVSRNPAAWNAESLALTLVKSIRGPKGKSSVWRAMMKLTGSGPELDGPDIYKGMSGVLVDSVAALLVSTTVIDCLDPQSRLAAFGIWGCAIDSSSMAPPERWWAPEHVIKTVVDQVANLDVIGLVKLFEAWSFMRDNMDQVSLLRGLAVTGARGCPAASTLLAGTYLAALPLANSEIEWELTEFFCCATALLSERARFSTDEVHKFCSPLRDALPNLEAVMNRPLAVLAA